MRQELSVQPLTPLSHTISGVKKWLLGFLMVCQKSLVDNNSLVGFPGNYSHLLLSNILQGNSFETASPALEKKIMEKKKENLSMSNILSLKQQ